MNSRFELIEFVKQIRTNLVPIPKHAVAVENYRLEINRARRTKLFLWNIMFRSVLINVPPPSITVLRETLFSFYIL